MVTMRLPSALRATADGSASVYVEGATLAAALDMVGERFPALERRLRDEQGGLRRYVNFFVDGEECRRLAGPDTPLSEGAEVVVIPSVAGG